MKFKKLIKRLRLAQIVQYLLVGGIIYAVTKYFINNLQDLQNYKFGFNVWNFWLAISFGWLLLICDIGIFHNIMHKLESKINFKDNLKIWTYSFMGIYLPGKVGVVVSRAFWSKRYGVSMKKTIFVFYLESIISIVSSLLVFLLSTLGYDYPGIKDYKYLSILLIVAILISLNPRILNSSMRWGVWMYKKERIDLQINLSYLFYLKLISISMVKWALTGLAVFFLINSISNVSMDYLLYMTGNYALSGVIAFFAFFAPSGIGVLEGSLTYFFQFIMPGSMAVLVSLFLRIWKTLTELSLIGLLLLYFKMDLNNLMNKNE